MRCADLLDDSSVGFVVVSVLIRFARPGHDDRRRAGQGPELRPLNAIRHLPVGQSNGWYVW